MVIYLVLSSPITSSVLYLRTRRAASMPRFELASDGVYRDPMCYHTGGKLLPYLSTLTRTSRAVYFCCTFLRVAPTRRYLASCPVKPGLSSPAAFRFRSSDHLSYSKHGYHTILFYSCPVRKMVFSLASTFGKSTIHSVSP